MCYSWFILQIKRTTNDKKNSKFSNFRYHIKYIKDVQHKNINITKDYWKFPRHKFAAEKFEMRGRNTIILNYHYRVGPELGKGVCDICWITCACPACVAQLNKYCLPTNSP